MFFYQQNNHFDLQIPGGGVGLFNGCQSQWNAPADGWGSNRISQSLKIFISLLISSVFQVDMVELAV